MTTTAAADRITRITISTTPPIGSGASFARRSTRPSPLVGLVARTIAGVTGALLGVAIGLVSAGFDTTQLLLAVGGLALVVGWAIAIVTDFDSVDRPVDAKHR